MAAKEPVHTCFEGFKAKQIPKLLKGVELPQLTWSATKEPLNATELKCLVTALRDEVLETKSQVARDAITLLSPEPATAWSKVVLDTWEQAGSPAAHKWMLFQHRVFASPEQLVELGDRYNWTELVSTGKWARVKWYLSVVAEAGPHDKNIALFFELLCVGKLHGTVQRGAREFLNTFAKDLELATQDMLERAGLIKLLPTFALPFVPGEAQLRGTQGSVYGVGIDRGQLIFTEQGSHAKTSQIPDDLTPPDARKAVAWRADLQDEVMRWGGYLHYEMSQGATFSFSHIQREWMTHPVARSIVSSLLWKSDTGQVMRLEDGGGFDVNYDDIALDADTALAPIDMKALPDALRAAWYEHLLDHDMLLPFDVLQRDLYITQMRALLAREFVEVEEHVDVIDNLYTYGYEGGDSHESGYVMCQHKTFPERNARVFIEHTGYDIVEGMRAEYPSRMIDISFEDLFGSPRSEQEVYISVLAEVCADLAKIQNAPDAAL